MKQRIITKKLLGCRSTWEDIDIPEGWIVRQISTTAIAKNSSNDQNVLAITALIEEAEQG